MDGVFVVAEQDVVKSDGAQLLGGGLLQLSGLGERLERFAGLDFLLQDESKAIEQFGGIGMGGQLTAQAGFSGVERGGGGRRLILHDGSAGMALRLVGHLLRRREEGGADQGSRAATTPHKASRRRRSRAG